MKKNTQRVTHGEDTFAGQEMAARWWARYNPGPLSQTAAEEPPVPVRVALDELVRYTLESLPGIDRYLKAEDALRLGFEMGFSFQQALTAGELHGDDTWQASEETGGDSVAALFSPHAPEDAH